MLKYKWEVKLSMYFIAVSGVIYYLHYMIFNKPLYILDNFILQIAFMPIYVLLATVIVDQLLSKREKNSMLKKLNMVIGAFFSEIGNDLLKYFISFDNNSDNLSESFKISGAWTDKNFKNAVVEIKEHDRQIKITKECIKGLKLFMADKRMFLMTMISNPNLMEHESFTELLWAVFHLSDELTKRENIENLSQNDWEHLNLDIKRAYILLIGQWLSYMKHIKEDYPYLYSLAVRTNPFDKNAKAEI